MNTKMRKIMVVLMCFVMLFGLMPITSYAAANIDSAEIMITHPAHLESPDPFVQVYGNCRVDTTYNSKGHQNGLRWKDLSTGMYVTDIDNFVGGKQYELSVALISGDGYTFSAASTAITVNGDPATLTVESNTNKAKATITLTAANLFVNIVNVIDLDTPKAGETADFSASVEEKYTCEVYAYPQDFVHNGVAWYDKTKGAYMATGDKFEAGHEYAVNVYVQPKAGYEFPNNIQGTIGGKGCDVNRISYNLIQVVMEYPALEDTTPKHTHTPSEWRTTGAYHYKACTSCGEFLEQEDHKGGTATCSQKGKCTVCGYAYIEENENHNPDTSKWTACGELYHAHLCKDCGAHAVTEDHKPGPTATETEAQKCTVCGYIIAPAKGHTHKLTKVAKVDATCVKAGNVEYYTCSGCSDVFADSAGKTKLSDTTIAPLGHKASDDWRSDANYHWRTCTVCSLILAETKMNHEIKDGVCTTCNYKQAVPDATKPVSTEPTVTVPTVLETAPQETEEKAPATKATVGKDAENKDKEKDDKDEDDEDEGNGAILWIILGIVGGVAVGVGATVLVLAKKKKTNPEG